MSDASSSIEKNMSDASYSTDRSTTDASASLDRDLSGASSIDKDMSDDSSSTDKTSLTHLFSDFFCKGKKRVARLLQHVQIIFTTVFGQTSTTFFF